MKRYIPILCLTLAAGAFSCSRNDVIESPLDKYSISAVISEGQVGTRSILIDNPGIRVEALWAGGDRIGVFSSGTSNTAFTVTDADISTDGRTALFRSDSPVPSGALLSYYPYSEKASGSDKEIVVDIPSTQQYVSFNGVPQADPAANVMLGSGDRSSLVFRNVFSILKVGLAIDHEVTVKKLEFKDLSGASVCGAARLAWNGGEPTAEFSGNGKTITLNCGEGVELQEGEVRPFFLIVPARDYPKGFEITYVTSDGERISKTVGTAFGKKLVRSTVHPIGEISSVTAITEGVECELNPGTHMMTAEIVDRIKILETGEQSVKCPDGSYAQDKYGEWIKKPYFYLAVPKDLGFARGNYVIFTEPSDQLPDGGTYRVEMVEPYAGDYDRILLYYEANFAAPFKSLNIGSPMFDEEGNLIEGTGIDLDLASHLKAVVDMEGNSIPFRVAPNGEIILDGEATEQVLAEKGITRAFIHNGGFTTPKLSHTFSGQGCEATLSATVKIDTRFAIGLTQGEVQYVYFTATPTISIGAEFLIKGEVKYDKEIPLFTLVFGGIPAGPILITPELGVAAKVGMGASVEFGATLTYNQTWGTTGISYNKGDGFTVRRIAKEGGSAQEGFKPSLNELKGALYVYGGLVLTPAIGIYGLMSMGLKADCTLKFEVSNAPSEWQNPGPEMNFRLAAIPEMELSPHIATLGGVFSKTFKGLAKVEFSPIWERYTMPKISGSCAYKGNETEVEFYLHKGDDAYPSNDPRHWDTTYSGAVTSSMPGVSYDLTLSGQTLYNYKLAVDTYSGEILYYPTFPWNDGLVPYQYYIDAGVEHLAQNVKGLGAARKTGEFEIGDYPANRDKDEEDIKISGFIADPVGSGSAVGTMPVLVREDGLRIPIRGKSYASYYASADSPVKYLEIPGSQYRPQIYYWPERPNGKKYTLEADQ